MQKWYDYDILMNQRAQIGVIDGVNELSYDIKWFDYTGLGPIETVPKEFVFPARYRAWFNIWQSGGYQSYLIGYLLVGGLYLMMK